MVWKLNTYVFSAIIIAFAPSLWKDSCENRNLSLLRSSASTTLTPSSSYFDVLVFCDPTSSDTDADADGRWRATSSSCIVVYKTPLTSHPAPFLGSKAEPGKSLKEKNSLNLFDRGRCMIGNIQWNPTCLISNHSYVLMSHTHTFFRTTIETKYDYF